MAEKSSIRFRAETEYTKARGQKANTNLPIMATVGDHLTGAAAVVGRPGWYHIRLGGETVANPNPTVASRLTQCKAEGVGLILNDLIFVVKARDRNLTYYKFHSFIQNTTGTSPYPVGIIIADNVNPAYFIQDDGTAAPATIEYVRIDTSNAQPAVIFNDGGVDVDFTIEASGVADAFQVRGADGQITLGALGAGLLESNAGGVISSDYTISGTVTMATGLDIDPFDASGQDLGDATHRWDLYTQEVIFGGATGANIITIPDNVADALHIIDDTDGDVFFRIVTTTGSEEVIFNDGGDDVDFRVEAVGVANAFLVDGAAGGITVGGPSMTVPDGWILGIGPALERIVFDAAGDISVMGADLGVGTLAPSDTLDVGGTIRDHRLAATSQYLSLGNHNAAGGYLQMISLESQKKDLFIDVLHDESGAAAGTLQMYFRVGAASAPVTAMRIVESADVGIGVIPQGRLHGFDTHGGFMYWEGDVDGAAEVIIIPNGAGDVERVAYFTQITWANGAADYGCTHACIVTPADGPSTSDLYADGVPNRLQLQLKANGELVLLRTQGADTYDVVMWIVWQ